MTETQETQQSLPLKPQEKKPDPLRRPWLYYGTNKIEDMSNRQIRNALRQVCRGAQKRLKPQEDKTDKASLIEIAFATALEVILDSHMRGHSPYPR